MINATIYDKETGKILEIVENALFLLIFVRLFIKNLEVVKYKKTKIAVPKNIISLKLNKMRAKPLKVNNSLLGAGESLSAEP